jgi:serine phosphatase RsbU (regulator of sigma subunit)/anti-anti-sigma regulatory factor
LNPLEDGIPFQTRIAVTARAPPREESLPAILIVDDDPDFRQLLVRALGVGQRVHVEEAANAAQARGRLGQRDYDVVITDLSMPGEDGLALMRWAEGQRADTHWIVLTGHGTFDAAVSALQLGAFDFLSKPLQGLEPLRKSVRNALEQRRLVAERDRLDGELRATNDRLVEHVTQLEHACRLLREQTDGIRADLHRAAVIQRALLPQSPPQIARLRVDAVYRPSQNVGGDLYDVVALDERHLVLLIADAAGHGLSAAMLAVLFRSQLHFVDPDTRRPLAPRAALHAANQSLCEGLPAPGLFLTAAYCLLDTWSGRATIASAGHPPLLLLRDGGEVERVFHSGPALGLYANADFGEQTLWIGPGDRMLFYSDGLYERLAGGDEQTTEKILAALEKESATGGTLLRRLTDGGEESAADVAVAQRDDATVMLLSGIPGPSAFDNGAPSPLAAPAEPARSSIILRGESSRGTVLSIQGRPDWVQSAEFHRVCSTAIETGRDVMIDLALCPGLDSTFLGTLHDLANRAEEAGIELRLQGATPPVEELFRELGMELVTEHLVPRMLPLPPRMEPLARDQTDDASRALHLLRAHEGLAGLNDSNRREFDPLLTALRKEIAVPSS